jgi:CRP-like cAMP-binding protein
MLDLFIRRLQQMTQLPPAEIDALREVHVGRRRLQLPQDLVAKGADPQGLYIIESGFAARYTWLPNGRRQILGFLLPGDFFGLRSSAYGATRWSIGALTPVEFAFVPRHQLAQLSVRLPFLAAALAYARLVDDDTTREWLLNVGTRGAASRLAHLLCELFTRLEAVGLTSANTCTLPLRQADLADALALTPVHVNRVLMSMRRGGLLSLCRQRLTLANFPAIREIGGFESEYLCQGPGARDFCALSADFRRAESVAAHDDHQAAAAAAVAGDGMRP